MLSEQEILAILSRVGAIITDSHIVYTSGKHGTAYVNKDALFPELKESIRVARAMAGHFMKDNVQVVIGPAVGGALLARDVARELMGLTDKPVRPVYAERDEQPILKADKDMTTTIAGTINVKLCGNDELVIKKHGFVIKRGYNKIVAGKNVLVVEDVLTTGGSAKKVIEAARATGGNVIGLAAICNRGGVTPQDLGNIPRLSPLVIVKFDAEDERNCPMCKQGIPVNTDVGKGHEYLLRKQKRKK